VNVEQTSTEDGGDMFKKIVWANDGSIMMERLRPVVTQLAESNTGAKVIVAHVQEHLMIGRRAILEENHRALDEALQKVVDDLTAEGVDAELALIDARAGHAGDTMAVHAAQAGADLIVAGTHGQGAVAGFFKGGFTIHLLQAASCPVLVVPRPEPLDGP
jgi:nucleotide-binding universal stress UspA family protein